MSATIASAKCWVELHVQTFKIAAQRTTMAVADDDCLAIGTYASAEAQFGAALLWTAPVAFPMMFAVVYVSSKLGR